MVRLRYVALALLIVLLSPAGAYAQDINYVDSFSNGIETLKGNGENEPVTPEKDFNDSYEVEEVQLRATNDEQPTDAQGNIEWVTQAFNTVPWNNTNSTLFNFLRAFFGGTNSAASKTMKLYLITIPIGICFMWWGLRKALRMIMTGFRKGKASV